MIFLASAFRPAQSRYSRRRPLAVLNRSLPDSSSISDNSFSNRRVSGRFPAFPSSQAGISTASVFPAFLLLAAALPPAFTGGYRSRSFRRQPLQVSSGGVQSRVILVNISSLSSRAGLDRCRIFCRKQT